MPELPEVESRLLYLRRTALGQVIRRVIVTAPGIIKCPDASRLARRLKGRRFVDAARRGKYLIVTLDDGCSLILHFGMGGDLIWHRGTVPPHTRIEFLFEKGRLAFTCPRNICRVMLVEDAAAIPALRGMGPEPLGAGFAIDYLRRLVERSPRRQIKPLLMDQTKIAGVGNIYADEILFQAGVLPTRRGSSLTQHEVVLLHRHTRRVLRRAIPRAGEEEFPRHFLVSRSARGLGCRRCLSTISRMKVGGRTSYFCSNCQK
jgi:formamidopyrimidine-DNA glycosylase